MACALCQESCPSRHSPATNTISFECSICGPYRISLEAYHIVKQNEALAFGVGSWVCQQNGMGTSPFITEAVIERVRAFGRPDTKTRIERYLGAAIGLMAGKITGRFDPADKRLRIASWSYLVV